MTPLDLEIIDNKDKTYMYVGQVKEILKEVIRSTFSDENIGGQYVVFARRRKIGQIISNIRILLLFLCVLITHGLGLGIKGGEDVFHTNREFSNEVFSDTIHCASGSV